MTDEELNKLQGLINSGSPTNWELVRLILEADGECDGKLLESFFRKMLIGTKWTSHGWIENNLLTESARGRKASKFMIINYNVIMSPVLYKETKVYDRFRENNKSD